MTFPLKPATAFSPFITVIPSDTLNAWRTSINEALDGTGGGTYAPMTQLTIGGAGLKLTGATALELDGTSVSTLDFGGTLNMLGTLAVGPNGFVSVIGSGAGLAILSIGLDGLLQVGNGGAITVTSSGHVNLYGAMTVENTGSITVAPDGGVIVGGSSGHPGVALFQQYATATWQNGSFLTGNATATFAWYGPMNISGAVSVSSTGSITVAAGGVLTTDLPASTAAVGANNIKSIGVAKAWGEIAVNSTATPTVNDGFNIASVSASGTDVSVVFAQAAAAGAHYSVSFSTQSFTNGSGQQWPVPFITAKSTTGFSVEFREGSQNSGGSPPWNAGDLIAPNAVTFAFSFDVHTRQ